MEAQRSTAAAATSGSSAGAGVQRFDSGLQRPQRSVIRQALVDRLGSTATGNGRPLLKLRGGYLARIGMLPRVLKSGSEEDVAFLWIALQGAVPALCVALGRMDLSPAGMGGEDYTGELEIAIYSVSQNLRALVDGRLSPDVVASADPTADPGIETMMEHVREILSGQELGIDGVHELRPRFEDELATGGDVSIWEQRFTAIVEVSVNPQRANSDLVTSIETQHVIDTGDDDAVAPLITITDLKDS